MAEGRGMHSPKSEEEQLACRRDYDSVAGAIGAQARGPKPWTKPEITRLGTIRDVGHQAPGVAQGGSGKS